MDEELILESIHFASTRLGISSDKIHDEQKNALISFMQQRDVFVGLPTGSGKSLIFQAAPIAHDYVYQQRNVVGSSSSRNGSSVCVTSSIKFTSRPTTGITTTSSCTSSTTGDRPLPFSVTPAARSIVIIVSPLVSLMQEQVKTLKEKGLRAYHLFGVLSASEQKKLDTGSYQYIFTSPEQLFKQGLGLLKNPAYKENLVGLFLDESHCVVKWGLGSKQTQAFRSSYGRLGEVRSHLAQSIPIVALTATASVTVRMAIAEKVNLKNPDLVIKSPEKQNIRYSVMKINKQQNLNVIFGPLITELKKEGMDMERVIIFCRCHRHCRELYALFSQQCPELRHVIAMFHSTTEQSIKDRVARSFSVANGEIRLLFTTIAFGMGVNVKGVNTIVHFGPSSDIDDYCQESGRGGRDGSQSYAILINYSGSSGRYKTSDGMKYYVNNEEICRRELLLEPFGCKPNSTSRRALHLCCDICACRCKCGDGACGDPVGGKSHIEQILFSTASSTSQTAISKVRSVDEEQKEMLRSKLEQFRSSLLQSNLSGKRLLSGDDIASGFPKSLIEDIVKEVNTITGVDYLQARFVLLNLQHASRVIEIINSATVPIGSYDISVPTEAEGACSETSSLSDVREINLLSDSSDSY